MSRKGDVALTPQIAFTGTKATITAWAGAIFGMEAITTDTAEKGVYDGTDWQWSPIAGGSGSGVVSVSGDGVDNTDPANPVLTYPTTADVLDSMDKRYVTDAELVVIGDTSGVNTGDNLDGWITTAITGTPISQAYTNDPAAGQNIVLNMVNTSKFSVLDYVLVSSSAGSEMAQVKSIVANTSITVNYLALNHTTSSPVVYAYAFTPSSDPTGYLKSEMKLKFTQGTVKYAVVVSTTSTVVKLAPSTEYPPSSTGMTNIYFSVVQTPLNFPKYFSFACTISATTDPVTTIVSARYSAGAGGTYYLHAFLILTAVVGSGHYRLNLPIPSALGIGWSLIGYLYDASLGTYWTCTATDDSTGRALNISSAGLVTHVSPFTWAVGDAFLVSGVIPFA